MHLFPPRLFRAFTWTVQHQLWHFLKCLNQNYSSLPVLLVTLYGADALLTPPPKYIKFMSVGLQIFNQYSIQILRHRALVSLCFKIIINLLFIWPCYQWMFLIPYLGLINPGNYALILKILFSRTWFWRKARHFLWRMYFEALML